MRARFAAQRSARAFTLVELVISSSLMALILSSAYLCLRGAMSTQRLIEPRAEAIQTARVVLAQMSADLRCACPLPKGSEFLGVHRMLGEAAADSLDFATHNYTPRRAREGDFCEVSFFVDRDPRSGKLALWRRRNPTLAPDPLSGGSREELAEGVAGLTFEFSDGYDWYESWGDLEGSGKEAFSLRYHPNLEGMPNAVRITLRLDCGANTNEPPMVFQTVASLRLAAALEAQLSAAAASGQNSGAGNSAATPGANQGGSR